MWHLALDTRIPFVYELFWQPQDSTLGISILSEVLPGLFKDAEKWPATKYIAGKYKKQNFQANPETGFGFESSFFPRLPTSDESSISFGYQLPVVEIGSGRDKRFDYNDTCLAIETLSMLLRRATILDNYPESGRDQLATFDIGVANRSMHGFPLGGELSYSVINWLSKNNTNPAAKALVSMKQVFARMYTTQHNPFRASVRTEDGRFNLAVPGDCACLGPDFTQNHCLEDGVGYRFGSHNVDTPVQQLALLVGTVTFVKCAKEVFYSSR